MPPNSNLRIIMCRVPAKKFGEVFVDSQRNVPVFSQRILPDTECGLNQYLKKQ